MKNMIKISLIITAIGVAVKVKKNKNYSKVFLARDGIGALKLKI